MRTVEQISEEFESTALDGRDTARLVKFIPEDLLGKMGIELKDEFKGKHVPEALTREAVLAELKSDLDFAFEKALGQRGLSAGMMHAVIEMWMYVLDDELQNMTDYAQYGLPLLKAVAIKYDLPNPIGDDSGNEQKYAA